uniref:RRM domain-containing protein n=1 Tax=Glossina brevipalpis TaxID=37001 RepID=A0A1A9W2T8_9MUSC
MQNQTKSVNISDKMLAKKQKRAAKRARLEEERDKEKRLRDPAVEAATVFVSNLPITTKRVQLIRLFKDYEPINSICIRTADGQIWRNYKMCREAGSLIAYVVLKDKETAELALALNGVKFKGNHLRITPSAKETLYKAHADVKRTIFVGNLKHSTTEKALREIFSNCGIIDYIRCLNEDDYSAQSMAYVCFKSPGAVRLALELNETILDERLIRVERYNITKLGAEIKKYENKDEKRNKPLEKDGEP